MPIALATRSYTTGAATSVAGTALVALTDSSGGTASGTIAAIGASYSQTEVRNAIASLAAKVNGNIARLNGTG